MPAGKYVAPGLNERAFHCPLCGVFANQTWEDLQWLRGQGVRLVPGWRTAFCAHCSQVSFWRNGTMLYPSAGTAPLPSPDLPADIKKDYEEARSIVGRSPRGAAALLRLSIQKLCVHLGGKGKNIDQDIAGLVEKGLPARVQKALDTVRVTGNEAVHPGTLDLRDNPEMAASLFGLVNFIVEKMITEPNEIDGLYALLPTDKLEAIEKRDKK